jgi:hypothetical protein
MLSILCVERRASFPTSFGKSVLIHAYIAQRKPKCAVVIVPTIALLDQFRRNLSQHFGSNYSIITRNDQLSDEKSNRIFVLTQERLLDRTDLSEIDLLAIDEYYKLDDTRERSDSSNRAIVLNTALRKYLYIAKQIFFLGPTVASIAMREDLRPRFTEFLSDTSTVAVDVFDHTSSSESIKCPASRSYRHFLSSNPGQMQLSCEPGSQSNGRASRKGSGRSIILTRQKNTSPAIMVWIRQPIVSVRLVRP